MARLKVYVTPIGFHDAFVAAPSQKAALEAWGTDANLFARGAASLVTDAQLTAEPLASPGKVIKRLRGTEAEQIAALGRTPSPTETRGRGRAAASSDEAPRKATDEKRAIREKPRTLPPRPSRKALDAAEEKLATVEARFREEQRDLSRQIAALQEKRKALRDEEEKAVKRAGQKRDAARERYQAAVGRWAEER